MFNECVRENLPDGAHKLSIPLPHMVEKLSNENAYGMRKLMESRPSEVVGIMVTFRRMADNYFDLNSRVKMCLKHYEFAASIGARIPLEVIRCALGNHERSEYHGVPINDEQEKALIRLEHSRWDHEVPVVAGEPVRLFDYDLCVERMVVARPADVMRIIEIAQSYRITHEAQLIAMLDGEAPLALAEGAL